MLGWDIIRLSAYPYNQKLRKLFAFILQIICKDLALFLQSEGNVLAKLTKKTFQNGLLKNRNHLIINHLTFSANEKNLSWVLFLLQDM